MIFKRKLYNQLLNWKSVSHGHSAALVEGARRVGKSTIVEQFAKNEYDDYMILDFSKESIDIRNNFVENIGNMNYFFQILFAFKGKPLVGKRCLIVFDEVQLFPLARQAIKHLVADGRYDYIETGSLISIKKNVTDILIPSEEEHFLMYPMDFEEFLWACGNEALYPMIKECFEKRKPLGDRLHRHTMKLFRTYMAVGGMPQAVSDFVNGKNFEEIDHTKRNILELYHNDLKKYDSDNKEKASVIFNTLPEQLENKNSHFRLSKIDKNARYREYVDSISFLEESMIGNECINVTEPEIMLELFADRGNFKMYMGDTGLLVTQIMKNGRSTSVNLYASLIADKLSINKGILMENMVAQMLRAANHNLFFHEYRYQPKDSLTEQTYEIDFLIEKNRKLCPIEVKSSNYLSHKSFDYLIEKYDLKVQDRYIIYTKDLKEENGITYLPIYMTECL